MLERLDTICHKYYLFQIRTQQLSAAVIRHVNKCGGGASSVESRGSKEEKIHAIGMN